MPAQIKIEASFKRFTATLDENSVWTSDTVELAHLLNAFNKFHARHTYGPDKGFFHPYILGLLTAHMGAEVEWQMPTKEELAEEARVRETGIQTVY